jgi:hypothetical protein
MLPISGRLTYIATLQEDAMKKFLTRLGTACHQIFTYLNLIDDYENLSVSKLTLYTSFTTTFVLIWMNFTIPMIIVAATVTFLSLLNYAYRRWLNSKNENFLKEISELEEKLEIKTREHIVVNTELSNLKHKMNNFGAHAEGAQFRKGMSR